MSHWKESDAKSKDAMKLRRRVKQAGDIEIPMDEQFYENLHNKIMASIEETDIKPLSKLDVSQQLLKRHWRSVAQVTSALLLLLGINQVAGNVVQNFWSSSHTVQVVKNEKQIINQALASPEEFSDSMISFQGRGDFLLDVASRNLDQIADDQLISMIKEMPN